MNVPLPGPGDPPDDDPTTPDRSSSASLPRRSAGFLGRHIAPLTTLAVSLVLYVPTVMPGVDFWDTAEFQTVGPVLGIAHPTGFPTYTLLTWLASVILAPLGETAYRINLLSALLVAGAAALVTVSAERLTGRRILAIAAGLTLAVAPIAWWTSTRADAHALHLFLLALLVERLTAWGIAVRSGSPRAARPLLVASFVYALALGNHGLTVLLAPGIAVYLVLIDRSILRQARLIAACAAVVIGTTVLLYAYIPIRASMQPPLNYAHPYTLGGFLYLVLGTQFGGLFQNPFGAGLQPLVGVYVESQGWPVVAFAAAGFAVLILGRGAAGRLGPPLAAMTGLWFALTTVFAAGYGDGFIGRYYLGPLLILSLWAAAGVAALLDAAHRLVDAIGPRVAGARPSQVMGTTILAAAVLAWPAWRALDVRATEDASQETAGRRWGEAVLAALEPDAVVISWWSYSTNLWYLHYVDGRRPDILIVDDRDRLDEGYGSVPATVERFRSQGRPVYLVPSEGELNELQPRYQLVRIPTIPGYASLWRVAP